MIEKDKANCRYMDVGNTHMCADRNTEVLMTKPVIGSRGSDDGRDPHLIFLDLGEDLSTQSDQAL